MRVRCPFCGERESGEFVFAGDAGCGRPEPDGPDVQRRFHEAVYVRDNPAGRYEELWYHASGCRSWLRVIRDTRTHEVYAVDSMKKAGD